MPTIDFEMHDVPHKMHSFHAKRNEKEKTRSRAELTVRNETSFCAACKWVCFIASFEMYSSNQRAKRLICSKMKT